MTLNGVIAVILRYFTEFSSFRAYYIKVVEDIPYFLRQKCSPKHLVFIAITSGDIRGGYRERVHYA